MNNIGTQAGKLGIILTDNVDMDWLKSLTPRHFDNYIKFVVNPQTNKVCVGMQVHRNCAEQMGGEEQLLGGNIFFDDAHIEYESTLNMRCNLERGRWGETPRVIVDEGLISQIDGILKAWVLL